MGGLSLTHIALLAVVVLVLFSGRGRISSIMGDFGKGLSSFRKGLTDLDAPPPAGERHSAPERQTAE